MPPCAPEHRTLKEGQIRNWWKSLTASQLIGRAVANALMRPHLIVKVDPALCCTKKLPQRLVAPSFSSCQLKRPDKALGIAVIGGRSGSTYRAQKAFFQQCRARRFCPILTALIRVKNRAGHFKGHLLDGGDDQFRRHVVIKGQRENMPGALPQGKAAAHFGSMCQRDFKNIREDDFLGVFLLLLRLLWWAQQVGHDAAGFPRVDGLLALTTRRQAIFFHYPLDPIFPHLEQHSQLAVAQRVIKFVSPFDSDGDLLVFLRLL